MSISQLDSKKQFAIILIVAVVLLGLYAYFRVVPAIDKVGKLNKQLVVDNKLLKNPNIPEEPVEDIEDLEDEVEQLEGELEQLNVQSSTLSKKMPSAENQDLMVKISDVARTSRVRIVNNVPYLTRKRLNLPELSGNKNLSRKARAIQKKRLRKAMKQARKAAARGGQGVGNVTREGELMDKLVNDFEVSRPLHQLKIEGTYHNIRTFIEALQGLPWQITVVKIDYQLLGRDTAQGYPQPLIVNMIIGA